MGFIWRGPRGAREYRRALVDAGAGL